MHITRAPRPSLRPFVEAVWSIAPAHDSPLRPGAREHVLPTGAMHLVFRLSDAPLRVFDDDDANGRVLGHAVVGGARGRYYVRDISAPSCSVGAMLRPGAAELLFGVSAEELSERHTPLDDLWGPSTDLVHEQLREIHDPAQRLAVLETHLERRREDLRLHPAVAYALDRFEALTPVHEVVRQTGYSHRHFIALFRRAVGLAPKSWCRVRRLQAALRQAARSPASSWAEIACDAGYADQAHLHRDFRALAGLTPAAYRESAPTRRSHVVARSTSFKTGGSRAP